MVKCGPHIGEGVAHHGAKERIGLRRRRYVDVKPPHGLIKDIVKGVWSCFQESGYLTSNIVDVLVGSH
jgi:hypothetical protein